MSQHAGQTQPEGAHGADDDFLTWDRDDVPTVPIKIEESPADARVHALSPDAPDDALFAPPPTPPTTSREPRDMATVIGRVARGAVLAWRRLATWAAPVTWGLAESVWRWPLRLALLAAGAVYFTPLTVGHLVGLLAAVAALAASSSGLAANRSERFASLSRWPTFRKRRRRVRRRWVKMWTHASLAKKDDAPGAAKLTPDLKRAKLHPMGVAVRVDGSRASVSVADVQKHARSLCSTVGARGLSVRVDRRRGVTPYSRLLDSLSPRDDLRMQIVFRFVHPFPRPLTVADLPPATRPGFVVLGLDDDHLGMELDPRMSTLAVGASGSGKSTLLWRFLQGLIEAGIPFRLRVFDPKGGTEMRELEEVAYSYERLPGRWKHFMGFAARALEHRQHEMRQLGIRTADLYDPRFPLEVMVIDELMTAMTMSRGEMEMFGETIRVQDALPTYLSQIRSANAMVFALSQDATKSVLETSRDLFTYVACLRVTPQATSTIDMLFGDGAHNAYPANELVPATREAANDAGIGYMRVEKSGVSMFRGAWLDDAERAKIARQIGKLTQQYDRRGEERAAEQAAQAASTPAKGGPRGSRARAPRARRGGAKPAPGAGGPAPAGPEKGGQGDA